MGRDLYTNGRITIANTAVAEMLAAAAPLIDSGDPITVEDLADYLYELAAGSPYNDNLSHNPDTAAVHTNNTETTIHVMVHDGRMQVDQWQTMMSLLAKHDADGSFIHETEGSRGDQYRSRLADGNAYTEPLLDDVFKNDIISYIGHMQRAPAQQLDFITVKAREDHVIAALLDELRTRDAPASVNATSDRQRLENWARRAGISWTVLPVTAP